MSIQHAAHALGGDVANRTTILCPGPGHSRLDRSLSVTFDADAPDGFLANSFAGDDWQLCRDHVRAALGIVFTGTKPPRSFLPRPVEPTPDAVRKTEYAAALWREARAIGGTPVETYLHARGIIIPAVAMSGAALRFHAACPFKLDSGEVARLPAMLGAMTGILSGEFQGVHRTALKPDGSGKAEVRGLPDPKKMLGSSQQACVRIYPDDAICLGLGIGEGIETTLTVAGNFGFSPVLSVLSASTMAHFPILRGVECLSIFTDNDTPKMQGGRLRQAGNEAAQACAERWIAEGREASIWSPPVVGTDFNNLVERVAA